jgi:hypothetical protein
MSPQHVFETNYPQIPDGFCYSGLFGLRPNNGLSWYWSCLANLEDLRLAADSYRPRHWVVPKNFIEPLNTNSANIEPGKTIFYEFQVKEGSWLWGMQFSARIPDAETVNEDLSNTRFSVVVRQGVDLPFSDRPMVTSAVYSGDSAEPFNTLKPQVNLLPQPRLIIPPAQLHVELSNDADPANDDFAVSCQLVLLFAEPK